MELIKLNVTPEFITARTTLTWREILFGIDNELLSPGAAVDFAVAAIMADEEPDSVVLELAGLGAGEATRDLVEKVAAAEPKQDADRVRSKWLYLALAWMFEHQQNYADPLGMVEEAYADFGYPEEVAAFVGYMPMDGPDLGSREANQRRLYENWRRYLENASREFGKPATDDGAG
jgi:hypothetical protein